MAGEDGVWLYKCVIPRGVGKSTVVGSVIIIGLNLRPPYFASMQMSYVMGLSNACNHHFGLRMIAPLRV